MTKARQKCFEAAINFNALGKGKESMVFGNYSYVQQILYYKDTPVTRILQSKNKKWGAMCKFGTYRIVLDVDVKMLVVPDISVFSEFRGDWFTDPDDIHGRTKYVMFCRLQQLKDTCNNSVAIVVNEHVRKSIPRTLEQYYNQWDEYRMFYDLDWPSLPQSIWKNVVDTINNRCAAYNDPAAVERRERTQARSQAKKALGLLTPKK